MARKMGLPSIILTNNGLHSAAGLDFIVKIIFGPPGGTRIMDLNQYLEIMNTNTNVI